MSEPRVPSRRRAATLLAIACLAGMPVRAQEVCGLQDANFDTIFADGFDPAVTGGGLGSPVDTVAPPTLATTPVVTITWPTPGTVLPKGKVQVVGTVTGSRNTGVAVAGMRAYVHNGVFATPEFTIDTTATNLTATATSLDGLTASADVAITVSPAEPDATLTTATPVGFSPLPAKFRLDIREGLALQSIAVDFDGNGTVDHTGTIAGDLPLFTYPAPGAYTATATLTVAGQNDIVVKHRVVALALAEQRTLLCSIYAHLRATLAAQDANGAGHALMGGLKSRLLPMFNALGNRMPGVAANLGTLADGLIGLDAADIVAVREVAGALRGYPIHFARDARGVWRIDSM